MNNGTMNSAEGHLISDPTSNHVGSVTDDSVKRGRFKEEVKTEIGNFGRNAKAQNDTEFKRKSLTVEELKEKVLNSVTELKNMEEYHHGDSVKHQKVISDIYWDYINERVVIGDYLADLGYAELIIKMLKQLNGVGIFKNDDIWLPAYYTYKTGWNFCDASEKLVMSLVEAGMVKMMTLNLGHKPYLDNMHSKNVYYILKASLSTLHNIARNAGVLQQFKDMKTPEVVLALMSSSDEFLKSMAALTIVYVVAEKDHAKYIIQTNVVRNLVNLLHKAIENKQKGKLRGLTPIEIAQGLACLAVNDFNKAKIIEEGALSVLDLLLQSRDTEEQAACTECLWTLAFDKDVRQALVERPELMASLENLRDSENIVVRKNARGVLWLIKGDNDQGSITTSQQSSNKSRNHIFISFSLSERDVVKKLCAHLAAEGFKLWVDWEQTGGCSLPAMARAVESSAVVLICMSEKYKRNPSCRTEAEMAVRLKKDYILLLKQKNFTPDGWLTSLLGSNTFFDFSGKYPYVKPLQGLIKELKGRGIVSPLSGQSQNTSLDEMTTTSNVPSLAKTATSSSLLSSSPSLSSSTTNNNNMNNVASLSNEHIEDWLVSIGFQGLTTAFSQIDGQLIWQLKRMRETTPEYFYNILERQFGLSLIDILRFNAALDTLQ